MTSDSLVGAIANGIGPAVAVILSNGLTWWAARRAIRRSEKAQKITAKAAMDALEAQRAASVAASQAVEAARQLIITAQNNGKKLDDIVSTVETTHTIVNSQRTAMENQIKEQSETMRVLRAQIAILLTKLPPTDSSI